MTSNKFDDINKGASEELTFKDDLTFTLHGKEGTWRTLDDKPRTIEATYAGSVFMFIFNNNGSEAKMDGSTGVLRLRLPEIVPETQ